MIGIRWLELTDAEQGSVKLALVIPKNDDIWGVMAPLKGTLWGDLIRTVPSEALSTALHGMATPLMRVIGPHPKHLAKKISDAEGLCALHSSCASATQFCRPGPKIPECFEAQGVDLEIGSLILELVLSWKSGRYVILCEGDQFSL